MRNRLYNLAIEASSRLGSVSLGCGDRLIATLKVPSLPPPGTGRPGNRLDLMPTIDRLSREHGMTPADLAEVYLSVGPGSFTGLRITIATAKSMAQVLGVRLVAVPTVEAIAHNVPTEPLPGGQTGCQDLAVCLSLKQDTVYSQLFRPMGGGWAGIEPARVSTISDLLGSAARPLMVVGDPLPPLPTGLAEGVTLLEPALAIGRSEVVWRLGRALARAEQFTDPQALKPLYARPPEAQVLWDKKHGPDHTAVQPTSAVEKALL